MTVIPTTTLPPKTPMCDYSFARPVLSQVKNAGVKAVIRYLSFSTDGKNIDAAERDRLHANGLGIHLLWENKKADPLQGPALGKIHGQEAVRQAKALGYPSRLPLYVAVDFDTFNAQEKAQIRAYVGAFSYEVRSNGYKCGWYGGSRLWFECRDFIDIKIRAAAGSWSPIGLYATSIFNPEIRQGGNVVLGGGLCDWDFTTTAVEVWLPHDTNPVLQLGSRGPYVLWMQTTLSKLGYKITLDGNFGPQTKNFVIWFQVSHGLPGTGIVDAATWAELAKV